MPPLRHIAALTLGAGLFLAATAEAQGFEGTITWNLTGDGEAPHQMKQLYKGGEVRTEMNQGGMNAVMLMDAGAKKMTMLMPERRMFMTMDLTQMGHGMEGMAPHGDAVPPKLTVTGRTETIAGRTCEVYRYAEEAGKPETMELCAAKGMGYFMMGSGGPMGGRSPMSSLSAAAASPAYAQLYRDGFFPLRVSRLEGGQAKVMMVATAIVPGSVDAAMFQVPDGYTEMKMPGGMPQRP
jgi:hypothetical protein